MVARAEPPKVRPLSNDGRAEQLFHVAEQKFDSGDYTGACSDFSESLKLGPKLGTLLNLALCHETVGKLVTAWSEFSHAAAWASQNSQKDRLEFATKHIRALEPKLPRVVLQLPTERAIDGLDLDGEPVPEQRWYLPLYLDPGEHRLAVTAPGKRRTSMAFRVSASPADQLVMVPAPTDDVPAPVAAKAAPPPPRQDRTRHTLGLVGLGAGAAAMGAGTVLGILAATADDRDAAMGRATAATIAFASGAVLAGTGGWLIWTSKTTRAAVGPAGVSLFGTF